MNTDEKPDVLAIHPNWVSPDLQAGDRRFAWILKTLEETFPSDLYMSWISEPYDAERLTILRQYFRGSIFTPPWRGLEATLCKRPYAFCLIEFWHMTERVAPTIRRVLPWAPIIVDTVDVHFVREEAALMLGLLNTEEVNSRKQRELSTYREADAVIVVTEDDAVALRSAGIRTPIHIIPVVVPSRSRPEQEREAELLFVGGFNHAPNVDGLIWFVRECFPHVRSSVADASVTVVGSNPPPEILALADIPGVKIVGYVPDTGPYLDRAAVSVAPLRYGGGMKGKVVEALAAGMPLVTTTPGVQGIPVSDGNGARVADSAEDFAAAIVWALSNRSAAEAMGMEGRQKIGEVCGPDIVSLRVKEMVRTLARRPSLSQRIAWGLHVAVFGFMAAVRPLALALGVRQLNHLRKPRPDIKSS